MRITLRVVHVLPWTAEVFWGAFCAADHRRGTPEVLQPQKTLCKELSKDSNQGIQPQSTGARTDSAGFDDTNKH